MGSALRLAESLARVRARDATRTVHRKDEENVVSHTGIACVNNEIGTHSPVVDNGRMPLPPRASLVLCAISRFTAA